ncbi:HAMP domain-containing histidine kinase [Inquilinus sp. KBS0705]|nr:HAMP domain-containing histidine kinase [Inquilinus sp. KBS0705]
MVMLSINIPINYIIQAPLLSLLMLGIFTVVGFIYYNSRMNRQLNSSIFIFGVLSNFFFIVNYFYNGGVNGPSLQVFILSFFLIIAIAPKNQYWFWIPQNMVTVVALLLIDHSHPEWIKSVYPTQTDRFIDFGYSYIAITGIICLVILYVRNNYQEQQAKLKKEALELEMANETKNKLLSVVAHDLRAPLSSIQSYLEILAEYKLDEDEKKSIEQDLLEKTKHTGDMLSNLLSWTMNQMDGVSVHLKNTYLNDTLKGIIQLQQSLARDKGIELRNNIKDTVCVMADANMLQLVVRNLISNAIKFTPPGGEISLTTEIREADCFLIIRDNGIGISGDRRDDIFSLKTKSTYGTKNEKGAGLGLVLCKEFTELQQGKIWFESLAREGTAFYISLKRCGFVETSTVIDNQNTAAYPTGKKSYFSS